MYCAGTKLYYPACSTCRLLYTNFHVSTNFCIFADDPTPTKIKTEKVLIAQLVLPYAATHAKALKIRTLKLFSSGAFGCMFAPVKFHAIIFTTSLRVNKRNAHVIYTSIVNGYTCITLDTTGADECCISFWLQTNNNFIRTFYPKGCDNEHSEQI